MHQQQFYTPHPRQLITSSGARDNPCKLPFPHLHLCHLLKSPQLMYIVGIFRLCYYGALYSCCRKHLQVGIKITYETIWWDTQMQKAHKQRENICISKRWGTWYNEIWFTINHSLYGYMIIAKWQIYKSNGEWTILSFTLQITFHNRIYLRNIIRFYYKSILFSQKVVYAIHNFKIYNMQ